MIRAVSVIFVASVFTAAASLVAHLFTLGNPVADEITMWLFAGGFVIGVPSRLILDEAGNGRRAKP